MNDNNDRNDPDPLEQAERYQRLFVTPVVEAMAEKMKAELQPIAAGQRKLFMEIDAQRKENTQQNERLSALEGSKTKAMYGWGVITAIAGAALALAADKLKSWFRA